MRNLLYPIAIGDACGHSAVPTRSTGRPVACALSSACRINRLRERQVRPVSAGCNRSRVLETKLIPDLP